MSDAGSGLVEVLSRLPAVRGANWRAASFEVVAPFTVEAPIPTSRRVRVASENFAATGVHVFVSVSARDVGMFAAQPAEQELALLPGARYAPGTGFHEVAGLRVQVMVELPADGSAVPAVIPDEELARIFDAARSEPDVAVSRPGRFGHA